MCIRDRLALVVDIGWGLLTRYAVSPGLSGRAAKPARGKHPAGEDVGRHDAPATSSAVLPVSYKHLTLPTSDLVEISGGAGSFKKKNN